ncbi:MAG: DUF2851 family protein [Chitinophagaceae bacterium]|nr:DUF2851 family protein [Chitinophagaceae bacterium]
MTLYLNEQLLQYIWQYQYFNASELCTTDGEPIEMLHPGTWNFNQGPDFHHARLKIADVVWAGTVELHMRSSDWSRHGHAGDPNYDAVILHVVWEHDVAVNDIPVLELKGRISGLLLEQYERLMHQELFIPCEDIFKPVPELAWLSWRERLLTERLYRRKLELDEVLIQTKNDWDEVCWRMLARNFGMRLNADAFEAMAQTIPHTQIARISHDRFKLEALLMGQAGLLKGRFHEDYPRSLQKEYYALSRKLKVQPITIPCVYLRMRPVNFPGIRLSQLAGLMSRTQRLFTKFRDGESVKEMREMLNVSASSYWDTHYRFDEESAHLQKQMGDMLADNIIVNTAVPLVFAYGQQHHDQRLLEKALGWLDEIKAEKNHIVHAFQLAGFRVESSADSQALLEMKKRYCEQHRCLECSIGNFLLKKTV